MFDLAQIRRTAFVALVAMLMLALARKLHRTHGCISFDQLREAGFNPGTP